MFLDSLPAETNLIKSHDDPSLPYAPPEFVDEIVYEDAQYRVRKLWTWHADSMYQSKETGLMNVILSDYDLSWNRKTVFATPDGKHMTGTIFDSFHHFHEGLVRVYIDGQGYGYMNKDMELVIPAIYEEAEDFHHGKAKVTLNGKHFFLDQTSKKLCVIKDEYHRCERFFEGMCAVSTIDLDTDDLVYFSDPEYMSGIWGYINESGEEVIAPQYIYALPFDNGIAIVAEGQWVYDEKQEGYFPENERWGGIDPTGKTVIPFIFDEIKPFADTTEYYIAHSGGWKNGGWGVIDRRGNWAAEPVFDDIDYYYHDGLIVTISYDENSDMFFGLYDANQKKVLFEPKFDDIEILDDGDLLVEIFDPKLNRKVEKIIDLHGNERFKSEYSSISVWNSEPFYEVSIQDGEEHRRGLIDKDGAVIVPCLYDVPLYKFDQKRRLFVFCENGKQGIKDFDGNTIVPAKHLEISFYSAPLPTVRAGSKNHYTEGIITPQGDMVIAATYEKISWCSDQRHFFGCTPGCCEMYLFEDKEQI